MSHKFAENERLLSIPFTPNWNMAGAGNGGVDRRTDSICVCVKCALSENQIDCEIGK